jgi:hypothetical protein
VFFSKKRRQLTLTRPLVGRFWCLVHCGVFFFEKKKQLAAGPVPAKKTTTQKHP